jgi:riboflavin synthase
MFTGIVTDKGRVAAIERRAGGARLAIASAYGAATIDVGASVACAGVCLTVVEVEAVAGGSRFTADVSGETLSCTTLGALRPDQAINLERALRAGDEIGGHFVQGHVDGAAAVTARAADGDSVRFTLRAPAPLARFIAPKGAVALDGASLTVNEVDGRDFGVNIIPHTAAVTTWGERTVGDRVNIEVDLVARYLARLGAAGQG